MFCGRADDYTSVWARRSSGTGIDTGIATRVDSWPFAMWQLWTESQNGKVDTWFVPGVDRITEWEIGHLACAKCGLNHIMGKWTLCARCGLNRRMGKWTLGFCQVWTES